MRIALVDDDADFLMQTTRLLALALELRRTEAEVARFVSAEALLEARRNGARFDLYLLDVIMPGMDGIELARAIRREQSEVPIVFFTTSREFALESYSVDAVDYVVKPFDRAAFGKALDKALRALSAAKTEDLLLTSPSGALRLTLSEIVFIEADRHNQTISLADGRSVTVSLSLQELWERLAESARFVRVGRQLIVNLSFVSGVRGGKLQLVDGRSFDVPRRVHQDVKDAFLRYFRG